MKTLIRFLPLLLAALTGCSSSLVRPVSNALLSGGGAAAGSILGRGNPAAAAGGAALGSALSEGLFQWKTRSEQRAFQTGYQQALSDQIKGEYWRQQFQHLPAPSTTMSVPVPLPERVTPDGVRLVPSTEYIQIHP